MYLDTRGGWMETGAGPLLPPPAGGGRPKREDNGALPAVS